MSGVTTSSLSLPLSLDSRAFLEFVATSLIPGADVEGKSTYRWKLVLSNGKGGLFLRALNRNGNCIAFTYVTQFGFSLGQREDRSIAHLRGPR